MSKMNGGPMQKCHRTAEMFVPIINNKTHASIIVYYFLFVMSDIFQIYIDR